MAGNLFKLVKHFDDVIVIFTCGDNYKVEGLCYFFVFL